MDFLKELLPILFMCVVIPALGILTVFIVTFIKEKKEELQNKIDNELLKKYTGMLMDTIATCVVATNQTYVNALKKQGKFDAEAQKEAFRQTYDAVMNILSEEAIHYLTVFYGDLNITVTELIEKEVAEAYNRHDDDELEYDDDDDYDIEETELDKDQILEAIEAYKKTLEND